MRQRPLKNRKTNFSSFIYRQSSTNPANVVQIGLIEVEIIGLTEITKNANKIKQTRAKYIGLAHLRGREGFDCRHRPRCEAGVASVFGEVDRNALVVCAGTWYVGDFREVRGVTQLRDVVYVVRGRSSTILRYDATTHQQLTDINLKDLREPRDIAACEMTSQLYVADWAGCVWRVSSDGADIQRWLPKSPFDTITPWTLSVTSSRLLVTSRIGRQLRQFDAAGDELRRVGLPDYMKPNHAVESPTATFIVGHFYTQLAHCQVSEVSTEGQVLRQFSGSSLGVPEHIAVDRQGNIFVADVANGRILLLDAQLALRRVIIDERQLNGRLPHCLCYLEQSGQLLVGLNLYSSLAVFDVLQR